MVKNYTPKKLLEKEQVIQEITNLWKPIGERDVQLLRKNIEIKYFKHKQVIYEETESPGAVMCLVTGKVKVFKEGLLGKRQIIRIMKPHDFFGFRAPFAGEEHRTGAMTLESCAIATLPVPVLKTIMTRNFSVSKFFIQELSYHLGQAEERTVSLTQKHVRGRLADTLLYLMENYGIDSDNTLDVRLSREDLASLSNMTTSNAIRTLTAFSNEGLIHTNLRHIKLLNIPKLREISTKE